MLFRSGAAGGSDQQGRATRSEGAGSSGFRRKATTGPVGRRKLRGRFHWGSDSKIHSRSRACTVARTPDPGASRVRFRLTVPEDAWTLLRKTVTKLAESAEPAKSVEHDGSASGRDTRAIHARQAKFMDYFWRNKLSSIWGSTPGAQVCLMVEPPRPCSSNPAGVGYPSAKCSRWKAQRIQAHQH